MEAVVKLEFYTPRWGHTNKYTFEMSRDRMEITMEARTSRCVWREGQDPPVRR